jgi:fructokinase
VETKRDSRRDKSRGIRALCFGETLVEECGGVGSLGGSPFMLAAHLARLGNRAVLYSRVGADTKGEEALQYLGACGVDTSYVQRDPSRATGRATLKVSGGEATVESYELIQGGAHGFIAATAALLDRLAGERFDVFCLQTLIQNYALSAATLTELLDTVDTQEVFYDLNLRGRYFSRKLFDPSLRVATVVRLNEEELQTVSTILYGRMMKARDFADTLSRAYAIPLVCIRRRRGGCAVYHAGSFDDIAPADAATVRCRGSGDAFNAAFLSLYCRGRSPFDSARAADSVAAHVASNNEAVPVHGDDVLRLLE